MNKAYFLYMISMLVMTSCASIQKIGLSDFAKGGHPVSTTKKPFIATEKHGVKFIDDITLKPQASFTKSTEDQKIPNTPVQAAVNPTPTPFTFSIPAVETASLLQIKYSILLNTEIEDVTNIKLIEYIDDWMGTKYCMGGTTKNCIDCSAFVQAFFSAMYSMTLPRTAREQYKFSNLISRTDMQEGDLLFFNTKGGISHVGIYLQNNKFVHAGSSEGVTISDIFEPYWIKRFIGVGRIERQETRP